MASQPVNVAVSAAAVQVYNPAVVGTPNVFIANLSASVNVYLGGSAVTYASGFRLGPGQTVDLSPAAAGIWAICNPGTTGTSSTLSGAAASGTAVVVAASATGFSTGSIVQIGTGNAAETGVVSSVSGGTVTLSSGIRFDHASGATIALVNAGQGVSVNVNTGTY